MAMVISVVVLAVPEPARAESPSLAEKVEHFNRTFDPTIKGWRTFLGDPDKAAAPDFNDSDWELVDPGYRWDGPDTVRWFRKRITIPPYAEGAPVNGATLTLRIGMDNGGVIFINGVKQSQFEWDEGKVVLSTHAEPGQCFEVAVRGHNGPGFGRFIRAELLNGTLDALRGPMASLLTSFDEAARITVPGSIRSRWIDALQQTIDSLRLDALTRGDLNAFEASVKQAQKEFQAALDLWGAPVQRRLERVDHLVGQLTRRLESRPDDYAQVDLVVGEQFREFTRQDVAAGELRKLQRAAWTADWMEETLALSLDSAVPAQRTPVPRYVTGPVAIREGTFYQAGQPLFFVGMGHFSQVRHDVPIFQRYGFNIIQITISPGEVVKSDSEYEDGAIDALVEVLDRAAKHHVAVDLLIAPHGFPGWALEKYPEVGIEGFSGFLNYKIDHPVARRIVGRFYDRVIRRVAGHPALLSYCLTNEPQYADRSDFSQRRFREWLQAQHKTIQTVNERYGSVFYSFSGVPIPEGGRIRGLWYDWCRFNQARLVGFHRFLVEHVREHDPKTPVHAKAQAMVFDHSQQLEFGPDPEPFAKLGAISGNDCWSYYRHRQRKRYAAHFLRQAMYYDLQRAIAPENPVFNSENHPLEDDVTYYVPGRHLRTVYWNGAIHGMGATTTWVWTRAEGRTLGGCILKRANCVRALGRTALDMNRFGGEIVKLQQAVPGAALLFARASLPLTNDSINEIKSAYEGCFFLDAPVTFVTDRQMASGRWNRHKMIVVPNVTHVEDEVVVALKAFARDGGIVLMTGDSLMSDEYGKPRDRWAALGVSKPTGASQTFLIGKGRLGWHAGADGGKTIDMWPNGVPYNVQLSPDEYAALIDPLLDEIGTPREVRCVDPLGRNLVGVELRSVRDGDALLINLTNYLTDETPVHLMVEGHSWRLTNLFTGRRQPTTFELEPLQPLLLRATRQ